jgi:hypothetical protein
MTHQICTLHALHTVCQYERYVLHVLLVLVERMEMWLGIAKGKDRATYILANDLVRSSVPLISKKCAFGPREFGKVYKF